MVKQQKRTTPGGIILSSGCLRNVSVPGSYCRRVVPQTEQSALRRRVGVEAARGGLESSGFHLFHGAYQPPGAVSGCRRYPNTVVVCFNLLFPAESGFGKNHSDPADDLPRGIPLQGIEQKPPEKIAAYGA